MLNAVPATCGDCLKPILMKPLQYMTNTEKAKLLAILFPEQLPEILKALQQGYDHLTQNEDSLRPHWDNSFYSYDFWYGLATGVANLTQQYGEALAKSSTLFAEKLFAGCNASYTIDCLLRQAKDNENPKYRQAVALLFE